MFLTFFFFLLFFVFYYSPYPNLYIKDWYRDVIWGFVFSALTAGLNLKLILPIIFYSSLHSSRLVRCTRLPPARSGEETGRFSLCMWHSLLHVVRCMILVLTRAVLFWRSKWLTKAEWTTVNSVCFVEESDKLCAGWASSILPPQENGLPLHIMLPCNQFVNID